MKDRAVAFRNGWSASMTKSSNGYYTAIVRTASGNVHDKIMCDDYRDASAYYKSFQAIARNA